MITLKQVGKFAFDAAGDGWTVRIDLPAAIGGTNTGPTPTDLAAIALASCKLITALKWGESKGLALDGISGTVENIMTNNPIRIGEFQVELKGLADKVDPSLHERMTRAIEMCHVAQTFKHEPVIKTVIG